MSRRGFLFSAVAAGCFSSSRSLKMLALNSKTLLKTYMWRTVGKEGLDAGNCYKPSSTGS
jgi:hypothetical protein